MKRSISVRESRFCTSVRSGDSSTSNQPLRTTKKKAADCCRKFIAFMFTQVGVGGLIVGYALLGALTFEQIEGNVLDEENRNVWPFHDKLLKLRENCSNKLWDLTDAVNVFNEIKWKKYAENILYDYQNSFVQLTKDGYEPERPEDIWTFSAALMFCLSVFTMIGFGNIVPKTLTGKMVTIVYAIFGIPLYVLYFLNMGEILANTFRWTYRKLYLCKCRRLQDDVEEQITEKQIIVPPTACLWVLFAYIATGTLIFCLTEGWSILDSIYFCVTSLCKLGFGDFYPGTKSTNTAKTSKLDLEWKLYGNFIYLLVGMGLVAMCYNLLKDVIKVKLDRLKRNVDLCFDMCKYECFELYRRRHPSMEEFDVFQQT